jgi:hypothetical protein
MSTSDPRVDPKERPGAGDPSAALWADLQKRQRHKKKPVIFILTVASLIGLGVLLIGIYIVLM